MIGFFTAERKRVDLLRNVVLAAISAVALLLPQATSAERLQAGQHMRLYGSTETHDRPTSDVDEQETLWRCSGVLPLCADHDGDSDY